MPPLELLIKFVLLLRIFQVTFSFSLLVANWRLSPELWSPKIFSTRHGDQNGRSLERCHIDNPVVTTSSSGVTYMYIIGMDF